MSGSATWKMIIRSMATALVFCALAGCGEIDRYLTAGPVGWALKQEVRDRGASRVVLSRLTNFDWDQLFVFGPYAPQAEVCAVLAVSASDCESKVGAGSMDDGEMVLAFRRGGELVHAELHLRWHGDLTPVPAAQPISRDRAVFRVLREGQAASGGPWIKLALESGL